jgi:hypothetical protein
MLKLGAQTGDSTVTRVARVLLGSTLLLSILSVNIPSAVIASGPMCNLACCAGRAPHAAGSCMNGSCHAFLGGHNQKLHLHHETRVEPAEQLCGLSPLTQNATRLVFRPRVTRKSSPPDSQHSHGTSKTDPEHGSLSSGAVTTPCQPECGSCASGFTNSNRQRDPAALAYADRPRPPSGAGRLSLDYPLTQKLSALRQRGAPRGPPASFS